MSEAATQLIRKPLLSTLDLVQNDFNLVYLSSSMENLNAFLKNRGGALFQREHANTHVILLGRACFMLVDHKLDLAAATKQMDAVKRCAHFTEPRTLRIQQPETEDVHFDRLLWIANMISNTFVPEIDYGLARYF